MSRWHDALPHRARHAIAWATEFGGIPDAEAATVRSKSRAWWLRVPNVGKRTIEQIEALIGPLAPGPSETELLRLRDAARERATAIAAERLKLARLQERDERHEMQANAAVCLIDALIEMRPYLPEEVV